MQFSSAGERQFFQTACLQFVLQSAIVCYGQRGTFLRVAPTVKLPASTNPINVHIFASKKRMECIPFSSSFSVTIV